MSQTIQQADDFFRAMEVLAASPDRQELERAAVSLARSSRPEALDTLGEYLGRREFLARLDDLEKPGLETLHLEPVLNALRDRPSARSARILLRLADNPVFTAVPYRLNFLLTALAAVRPMPAEAADLFRRMNKQGFFPVNAPLLAANGSPPALAVFEEMIRDRSVLAGSRVDALHAGLIRRRTEIPVLEMAARLMAAPLESEVALGLVETLFDYRPRLWFGTLPNPPAPPRWESASREALELVSQLAATALLSQDLPARLGSAIKAAAADVSKLLGR